MFMEARPTSSTQIKQKKKLVEKPTQRYRTNDHYKRSVFMFHLLLAHGRRSRVLLKKVSLSLPLRNLPTDLHLYNYRLENMEWNHWFSNSHNDLVATLI